MPTYTRPNLPIPGGQQLPSLPDTGMDTGDYPLYDAFLSQVLPRLRQNIPTPQMSQPSSVAAFNASIGQGPKNVVYQPPASDTVASRILGVESKPMSEYEKQNIGVKRQQIGQNEEKIKNTLDIANQKADIAKQRADIYAFKAKNPAAKYIIDKSTGHTLATNPISGAVISDFGQTQMPEAEVMSLNQEYKLGQIDESGSQARQTQDVRQKGAESLEEMKARHAMELKQYETSQKPIGSTEVQEVKDAKGNVIGARTIKKTQTLPDVTLYGKDGKPYTVPADKVAEAKSKGMSEIKPFNPVASH